MTEERLGVAINHALRFDKQVENFEKDIGKDSRTFFGEHVVRVDSSEDDSESMDEEAQVEAEISKVMKQHVDKYGNE